VALAAVTSQLMGVDGRGGGDAGGDGAIDVAAIGEAVIGGEGKGGGEGKREREGGVETETRGKTTRRGAEEGRGDDGEEDSADDGGAGTR
jgi:hypothetical protein